jgi:hypothetical protein
MSCDEVREQIPDYALGTLSELETAAIRRHLRGCGPCRADAAKLDEGVALFSSAAHEAPPPPELKQRVLGVLAEEWAETPVRTRFRPLLATWSVAAVVVLLAGIVAFAAVAQTNASKWKVDAASYQNFLHTLGGRDVRVASLTSRNSDVQGSAILYDSDRGQSWGLVLARSPDFTGLISVTLHDDMGRTIHMRNIELDAEGEGSTWLVSSADISSYAHVELRDATGRLIASGLAVNGEHS